MSINPTLREEYIMKIHFDGKPVEVGAFKAFEEYAQALEDLAQERYRVITEIKADGRTYQALDSKELTALNPKEISLLEIGTENPRSLSISILYDTARYMPRLSSAFERIAEKIQRHDETSAMEVLQECTSTWLELNSGLNGARTTLGLDFEEIMLGENSLAEIYNEVLDLLGEIQEVLEDNEMLELSDLLEYELAPRMLKMEEGIYQLINVAERKLH
jgi:hypothetical protein